ncbi:hypothetical protein Clacol_008027 [Clathrus columnatus]|uniref:Myb-like domain-containing protein n=1 Tax=Clathrus columnatus TaxID=1419009 RepID=A0AAV5AHE0_9AGAM|nr:hypothetical protein Clacol_008027 [Clathrus columnatus]
MYCLEAQFLDHCSQSRSEGIFGDRNHAGPYSPTLVCMAIISMPPDKPDKDKETKDKVSWTAAQEATLVAVLLEQMKQGNQAESGWKPIVWTIVISALEKEHPTSILKQATHCKKPEAHPKLSKWQTKSFPLFDDIATLIGDVVATGQHVFRVKSTKPDSPESSDVDEDNNDPSFSNLNFGDVFFKFGSQSSHKRQTRATGVEAIMSVSGAVESLAAALSLPDSNSSISQLEPSPLRHAKAFQIAEDEEGFSENEMVEVGILFEKSTSAADMYMAMRNKKTCQIWLRKRLDTVSTFPELCPLLMQWQK